ncbi:hypothetical protein KR009_008377, partial [Drosophila setifemur]
NQKIQIERQRAAMSSSVIDLFPTTINTAAKVFRYQHIMPAPSPNSNSHSHPGNQNNPAGMPIKTRKYTPRGMALARSDGASSPASTAPYNVDQSQSVQRRNARERNRVKQVNNSFARLRQHIPQSIIADLTKGGGRGPHKKISKVDTLRIAVEYIRRLQDLVDDLNGGPSTANATISQLQLCLDESSSHSSSSSSSSTTGSSSGHNLYYPQQQQSGSMTTNPLQQQQQLQRQQFPHQPLTPISMNSNLAGATVGQQTGASASANGQTCHSPTSSFNSSMSFDSGTYEAAPQQLSAHLDIDLDAETHSHSHTHPHSQLQLKFEPYEHFQLDEEDCTPDDEEILDYISLWQEQ